MKLEVGMFVRLDRCQGIARIDEIYEGILLNKEIANEWGDETFYVDEEDILKASHNIIDLIEVGDYVNGECVKYIDETHFNGLDRLKKAKKIGVIVGNDEKFKFPYHIKNEDIKSIVTKEQFENMNYKIGE
ncbi:MAG: hypothetical protein HFI08_02085 [Bacilli bacterium]|jgi:hypothetical protein|nr:hypothetical protein [Bacilli bacterium]